MVLKGVSCVHNTKIRPYGIERSQLGTICISMALIIESKFSSGDFNADYIVDFICRFYGFYIKSTWFHMKDQEQVKNIRSYGLGRSQLDTQYKNQVIWSWKESIGYTMIKLVRMVLKGVIWVHNAEIRLWSWKNSVWYTMIKSGQMVLKGVN